MAGLEIIYGRLTGLQFTGDAWIDGSFLTKKIDPGDIDLVAMLPVHFYDSGSAEQKAFIDWLINNENDPKKSFRCHTDVGLIYDSESPHHYLTVDTLRHWEEDVYGYSVATHEPKGIVLVKLPVPKSLLVEDAGVTETEGNNP